MWLCVCENIMKHFTACKVQFPACRRLTLFSCVMTILTSWKGYDRDDLSCQDFCTVRLLRTFPSHYSICKQHMIPVVQHLHVVFSCFLVFFMMMISLIGNTVVRVLLYIYCGPLPPPVPFNRSLPLHELWCIYQNHMCFLKIVVNGFQVVEKAQLCFSF